MIKRSFALCALIIAALMASTALPMLSTTEAAASQRTIWNASGLQQTSSTYWQPDLNQPANYTAPDDLVGGRAYMRLDVVSKPSDMYVAPMVCFWRHGAKQFEEETCAAGRKHPFTSEGTYYMDLGTPDDWWQKNGAFDWTKPVSLGRIMIRDGVQGGRLLLNERCGGACYLGDDLDDHVPIKMNSQLIFVPKGKQLSPPSAWRSECPASWTSACRGGEPTPVTTTPAPPTTPPAPAPGTTAPATTTTTTAPGPAHIDAEPGVRRLRLTYSIPRAKLYQVRFQRDGNPVEWTDPTESTSQTLRGLKAGERYTVSVRALVNTTWRDWISTTATPLGDGGSDPVDTVSPTTTTTVPVVTIPTPTTGAPTEPGSEFIDVVAGKWSLTVSYGIPKADLFQVRYQEGNKSTQWTDPTDATTQTLSGLKAGKVHTVEVRGLVKGTWRNWISTTATPLASDPTPAAMGVDVRASNGRIRVSWTFDGNATRFQIRSKAASKSGWKLSDAMTKTLVNLNGLSNGTTYDVEVRAQVGGAWQPWVRVQATPRS